jgi:hypothetical protein
VDVMDGIADKPEECPNGPSAALQDPGRKPVWVENFHFVTEPRWASCVELSMSQWSTPGPILGPGPDPAAAPLTLPASREVTAAQIPGNGKLWPAIPEPSVIDL